ncbi:MAG: ATP-binding protein [Planctomycetota bacterium]
MVHSAPSTSPLRAPRPAAELALARAAGDEAERVDALGDARLVRAFRRALSRRGVEPLPVFRAEFPAPLSCGRCFAEAVRALDGALERVDPQAAELGVFERYDEVVWYFEPVEEHPEPCEDYAPDEERPREGLDARFHEPDAFGLVRLTFPETSVWVWTYTQGEGLEALIAARALADVRPLLRAVERRHTQHRRRLTRMTTVGGNRVTHGSLTPLAWDAVVLPATLRAELEGCVREFFAAGELYRRHGVPHRRGILLAGPPGNGKTSILRAIGTSAGVPVVVTAVDEGGHNLARAFATAADLAPSILCLEDLDSLVGDGPERTQFLNLLDGLAPLEGVLVLATTNHPESIDPAITKRPSRFDRVFVIPEPDLAQREAYLARALAADAPPGAVTHLAEETAGYSVAFLKELVLQARLAAVRRGAATLEDEDLEAALAATRAHLELSGLTPRGQLGFRVEGAQDPR